MNAIDGVVCITLYTVFENRKKNNTKSLIDLIASNKGYGWNNCLMVVTDRLSHGDKEGSLPVTVPK